MSKPKQIIVMRKDLNMRKGKIASQAAHASMAVLLNACQKEQYKDDDDRPLDTVFTLRMHTHSAMAQWVTGAFTKVCVYVNSEQELDQVFEAAKAAGLHAAMITDSGLTEFNGVPTKTCCAIGPDFGDRLDPITGHLPLL